MRIGWLALMVGCGQDASKDVEPSSSDTDVADTDVIDTNVVDTEVVDTDTIEAVDTDLPPLPALLAGVEPGVEAGEDHVDATMSWAIAGPDTTAQVTDLELYLRGPGAAGDPLTVTLVADQGGPTGVALATLDAPAALFPDTAYGWTRVTFSAPVDVVGPFWVVLSVQPGRPSSYDAVVRDTGASNKLAMREGTGAWEIYGKTYEWPHRIYGLVP